MNIHEYQAKELFSTFGIPIPRGRVCDNPSSAYETAGELDKPVVVKAQIHTGGRGKAGGVKVARTPDEARLAAEEILGMKIKGFDVKKVLVEEAIDMKKEFYLGITLDRSKSRNVIMFSTMGGMDIEKVARTHRDMIFREETDPLMGLMDFQIRNLGYKAGLEAESVRSLAYVLNKLYGLYISLDCTLAEINPLILGENSCFIAADAKINLDDSALYRHGDLLKYQEFSETDPIELQAKKENIAYVRLPGDIGIIGNGAGLVMSTIDMVDLAGGKAANFLDIGGGAKADVVEKSINLILLDKNIKGIFINIFGGITRCDEAAEGIISAFSKMEKQIPAVIRLCGTNEREGREILHRAGFPTVDTMLEGAEKIVKITG